MLTKNQIKFISNLKQKKYREASRLFFVEGIKGTEELLHSDLELEHLYSTEVLKARVPEHKVTYITEAELKKISALTTPNTCLAVFRIPRPVLPEKEGLKLVLDDIRDPGNLGTIIRLCDWFGVADLICSNETVDIYNPKVVQATMGSITRVNVVYTDLEGYLSQYKLPVVGTFMDGESLYQSKLPENAVIVMGNEANGISEKTGKYITQRIGIPRFGHLQHTESLNVATATAIILSEFKRGH